MGFVKSSVAQAVGLMSERGGWTNDQEAKVLFNEEIIIIIIVMSRFVFATGGLILDHVGVKCCKESFLFSRL